MGKLFIEGIFVVNFERFAIVIHENSPFYSCVLTAMPFTCKRGSGFDFVGKPHSLLFVLFLW